MKEKFLLLKEKLIEVNDLNKAAVCSSLGPINPHACWRSEARARHLSTLGTAGTGEIHRS